MIKRTQIQFSDRTIHGLQQAGWAGWAGAVPRDVWECGAGMYCPWSMNIFFVYISFAVVVLTRV